jgi:catechol 2,3-dioxygenase-like lactoylglutathione lyase family enzyme
MELVIAHLLENFEEGKINRRQLIRSLTIVASVASVVTPDAMFAAEGPLQVTRLDHVSYTVADYAKTRDFYSGLLGLKISDDDGKKQCRLSAGNAVIVARTGSATKPYGLIDHIGYATELKDKPAIEAALKRRGVNPEPGTSTETGVHVKDPDGFNVQLNPKR